MGRRPARWYVLYKFIFFINVSTKYADTNFFIRNMLHKIVNCDNTEESYHVYFLY